MRNIRNTSITLTATQSNKVSEAKFGPTERVSLQISNMNAAGGNDVFVSVGEEATANSGIRIQPGQTITWTKDSGYTPPQDRINAYSAGATVITLYEELEV